MANRDHLLNLIEAIQNLNFALKDMGASVRLDEIRIGISRDFHGHPTRDAQQEFEMAMRSSPTYTQMMRMVTEPKRQPPKQICEIAGVRVLAPAVPE